MVSSISFAVAFFGKYDSKSAESVTEMRRPGHFAVVVSSVKIALIWAASKFPASKSARSFFPFAVDSVDFPVEMC